MTEKVKHMRTEIGSLRVRVIALKQDNATLRKENERLKVELEELKQFKALSDVELADIVEKHHQIVEVEAQRNKAINNLNAMCNYLR